MAVQPVPGTGVGSPAGRCPVRSVLPAAGVR